jgi:N-acetylmuramoyl-L-alanine amidase
MGILVPWLADAARSTGYPVVEVANWRTRGHGSGFRVVEGVVAHHTATAASARGDYPSLNIVTNGRAGLSGPLCNYGLGRSGTIYVIAAGVGYHAGASRHAGFVDLNDEFVGVEAEHPGDNTPWPAAQLDSYVKLVAACLRYIRRDASRYVSHRSCAIPAGRKPDPRNIADDWMRTAAARLLSGTPTPAPTPSPTPRPRKDDVVLIPIHPDDDGHFHEAAMVEVGSDFGGRGAVTLGSTWGASRVTVTALNHQAGVLAQWANLDIPNNGFWPQELPKGTRIVTVEGSVSSKDTRLAAALHSRAPA